MWPMQAENLNATPEEKMGCVKSFMLEGSDKSFVGFSAEFKWEHEGSALVFGRTVRRAEGAANCTLFRG